jgi:formiminotetrahydrofolate cyclodeaminase
MSFSTLDNAKFRFQGYNLSEELLAVEISDDMEKHMITIVAYVLPSVSEKEKEEEEEEISCYFTEVIADYSSPYKLDENIIEVSSISLSAIEGDIVFIRKKQIDQEF